MTIPTTSIEGIGLGPVADMAALPTLDSLLAQTAQNSADFTAAVEKFQLAMEGLPSPSAEVPVAKASVATVPLAEVPVAEMPLAEVPVEGVPRVDVKDLPPLDGLLAQNEQIVADFKATTEKLQRAIMSLPLPGTDAPVAKAPISDAPIAKAPIAEIPVEGLPHVEVKNLPPLDGLLAQNERIVADFEATTEKLQRAMKGLPLPETKTPVAEVPIAKTSDVEAPIAKTPILGAAVAKAPVAEIPVEGVPHVDAKDLPPLDGLLAQNERIVADFEATTEKLQRAMKGLPLPETKTPVTEVPIAKTPVVEAPIAKTPDVEAPIAKTPILGAAVAKTPVAEIPVEGVPHVDAKDLPPLDGLLAQNERIVADFAVTTEKLQLAMKGLPLPKPMDLDESVDGADVAAVQALPVAEVILPVGTDRVIAADGAGVVSGVEAVRPVEAVGTKELLGIAEAVADRVLVSPGLMQGDGEVRVLLKPDVLQGTEIRVVSENGTVTVNFIPATPEIAALLQRNQPMLVQHLATHVPSVRLGVSVGRSVRNRENV